jgi:protein gp37
MHPDWVRSLRDHCEEAGVPFLFKQWGQWLPDSQNQAIIGPSGDTQAIRVGKKAAGRLLDGRTWGQFPKGL